MTSKIIFYFIIPYTLKAFVNFSPNLKTIVNITIYLKTKDSTINVMISLSNDIQIPLLLVLNFVDGELYHYYSFIRHTQDNSL